uniref:DekiORF55 n=1 Tax=Dendrolimus kikuchii nucleopolyhedrovirus TaxID=1219875 RepID=V9LSV6_9ABAC|nr:DekiORF55 [Dendrolimus kikuchii nucleopolyhedrovirus]
MEDSQSLDIAQLTAKILTKNFRGVDTVANDDNYTTELKIKLLLEMILKAVNTTTSLETALKAVGATPSMSQTYTTAVVDTSTAVDTVATTSAAAAAAAAAAPDTSTISTDSGEMISSVLSNTIVDQSIIVANNFKMRYKVLNMGIDFYKKHTHLIGNKIAVNDAIQKVDYYLRRYTEYISRPNFQGQEGLEQFIIKAEDHFILIEKLFMERSNTSISYGGKINNTSILQHGGMMGDNENINAAIAALDDVNAAYTNVAGPSGEYAAPETAANSVATAAADTYTDDDEEYDAAYQSAAVDDTVKRVLLRMIEKAETFAYNRLHVTTLHQMEKLRKHITSDSIQRGVIFNFNIKDCEKVIKRLVFLCVKFFDVRCVPDTLETMVEAFYDRLDSLVQNENVEIKLLVNRILQEYNTDPSTLPPISMYRLEYESIQNKDVKALFDLYNGHVKINMIEDTEETPDAGLRNFKRKYDSADLSTKNRRAVGDVPSKRPTRNRTGSEYMTSDEDVTDEEEEDITDFEHDKRRREIEDEAYLRLKALEFSKGTVNENLQKIIVVTDEMKRLYEYCNCKSSLGAVPSAENYASLLKRLNAYNLNHIQMSVNFYEILFPLTLYDSADTVFYKIIKYIFLASVYFQNCAKDFYRMRQAFNVYGPFNQVDHMVMFVIKFNFLCDLRDFAKEVDELFPNKQPNAKIHSMLVMRDKVVSAFFDKLQYHMPTKVDRRRRNAGYLNKLIMLMNGDYNII